MPESYFKNEGDGCDCTSRSKHFSHSSPLLQTIYESGLGVAFWRYDLCGLQRDQEALFLLVQVGDFSHHRLAELEGSGRVADELVGHRLQESKSRGGTVTCRLKVTRSW